MRVFPPWNLLNIHESIFISVSLHDLEGKLWSLLGDRIQFDVVIGLVSENSLDTRSLLRLQHFLVHGSA
jgi:hypothetical protein